MNNEKNTANLSFTLRANNSCPVQRRVLVAVWLALLLLSAVLLFRNLENTHPQVYMNFDEYAYAAHAQALVTTGDYSHEYTFPEGFYEKGNRAVMHPMLNGYLEAVAIWGLGFSRTAIRLPSLIAYLLAGALLLAIWLRCGMTPLQGLGLVAVYFTSPWLIYAATTARPEMLSALLLIAACFSATWHSGTRWSKFGLAGALSGAATFNHPVFFGAACLPFLFLCKAERQSMQLSGISRCAAMYALGGVLAVATLFAAIIAPYIWQWKEQFILSTFDESSDLYGKKSYSLVEQTVRLKHRFSTFGAAYLNWYVALPAFAGLLLRFNWYTAAGVAWLLSFMWFVGVKTDMYIHYCVQFAAGAVIVILLCNGPRFAWTGKKPIFYGILAVVLLQIPWNMIRVTAPNAVSEQFAESEARAKEAMQLIPGSVSFTGEMVGAFPALSLGHRFFAQENWAFSPPQKKRLFDMMLEQADFRVRKDGTIEAIRTPQQEL
jgi:hypothetical protein